MDTSSLSTVPIFSYIFVRLLQLPIFLHISYIFLYFMIVIVRAVIVRVGDLVILVIESLST